VSDPPDLCGALRRLRRRAWLIRLL